MARKRKLEKKKVQEEKKPKQGNNTNKARKKRKLENVKHQRVKDKGIKSAKEISSNNVINEYKGWKVPEEGYEIESISIEKISPKKFYEKYISKRRPVVIKGFIKDTEWKADKKWTNGYLKDAVNDQLLDIEQRDNTKDSFGKGNEIKMKFCDFIDELEKGNELYYLTTQNVQACKSDENDEDEARPDLMAPFMKCLKNDFPLRPNLVGNLIPQNLNIWMGNNKSGSSSGLHHDYHDNLYLVLRGTKKFRLFSPNDAPKMYTRGTLKRIHPNGRINYLGEETTASGADIKAEDAANASKLQKEAELELQLAEQDVENGVEGAEERLEIAEEKLEKAMEAVLDAEIDDNQDDDDFETIEGELSTQAQEEAEVQVKQAQIDVANGVKGAKQKLQLAEENLKLLFQDRLQDDHESDEDLEKDEYFQDLEDSCDQEKDENENRIVDKTVKDPLNFSLIDFSLSKTKLKKEYPQFSKTKVAYCQVSQGNMLYLPASWFHEVTSFATSNVKETKKKENVPHNGNGGHLAFNYWFVPPDNMTKPNFLRPYSSNFWVDDWNERMTENGA